MQKQIAQQIISRFLFPLILPACLLILASCGGDSGSDNFFVNVGDGSDIPGEIIDEVLPGIRLVNPTIDVGLNPNLEVEFGEEFDPESFVAEINNGAELSTTLSANKLTITPASGTTLAYCTTYTLTLMADYLDDSEAPLNLEYNFSTVSPSGQDTWYISPEGSDDNDGQDASTPFRSFAKAFSSMEAADCLALDDGTYSENTGTGYINNETENSAQIPSGKDLSLDTHVYALNPGEVFIEGPLVVGSENEKRSFIEINGITFDSNDWPAGDKSSGLLNSSYITIRNTGFNGGFALGSNDHNDGNEYNLIEDVWIWGDELRHISHNYRSNYSTWRRVVIRGDGCNGFYNCDTLGKSDPSYAASAYNSHHVSFQNVVVLDRILGGGQEYADFIVAHHNNGSEEVPQDNDRTSNNEWLGTISLNSEDGGYYFEPDEGTTDPPTFTVENAVAWGNPGVGIIIRRDGSANVVKNVTLQGEASQGIWFADELDAPQGTVANAIVTGTGRGISTSFQSSHVNVYDVDDAFPGAGCSSQCLAFDPTETDPDNPEAPAALKYLTRIENRSSLDGTGLDGADIGATILNRYGSYGSRACEVQRTHASCNRNLNSLTSDKLWPWPNEERIKKEMCATENRGFCSSLNQLNGEDTITLTSYIWEFLGNAIPSDIYSN